MVFVADEAEQAKHSLVCTYLHDLSLFKPLYQRACTMRELSSTFIGCIG
jgi:hypothetical protein